MTAIHHPVPLPTIAAGPEHTITIEPLTAALRADANLHGCGQAYAIVERFAGGLIKVCDTAVSAWHARSRAVAYAQSYGAVLMLTGVQLARGDVIVDQHGRHTVTSVYPVDQISLTVHTDKGDHLHRTWSEAHTDLYVIDTRGNR